MSSIKPSYILISLSIACVLAGCGDTNPRVVFDSESGHPSGWLTAHKDVARNSSEPCRECHNDSLSGGVSKASCMSASAVNGFRCHASDPAANTTGCKSCHSIPPDGIVAPNRASAHATHLALPGFDCNTCHSGGGAGTANHARAAAAGGIAGATMSALDASFKAKSFTSFGFDPATGKCSGIICHGGQTTPNWNTTAKLGCLNCHEQGTAFRTPQNNSFYSGTFPFPSGVTVNLHQFHLSAKDPASPNKSLITCTHCHNVDSLAAGHFTTLTTQGFEVAPDSTVGGGKTSVDSYKPFTSGVPSGKCFTSCHAIRYWIN